jgi:DUF2905 family protein
LGNQSIVPATCLQAEWGRIAVVISVAMDPLRELGKALLIFGIVLACAGAFLLIGGKLPLRLGRLPGDIAYQGRNGSFHFPIVTCLLLSVGLTLLFWVVNLFRR